MEYWRKNCQNQMFYQLVSTMGKSNYSKLSPTVIYHGIIRFFNVLDVGKWLHNHFETIEEVGRI
jgi:hypothetical protein